MQQCEFIVVVSSNTFQKVDMEIVKADQLRDHLKKLTNTGFLSCTISRGMTASQIIDTSPGLTCRHITVKFDNGGGTYTVWVGKLPPKK